MSCTAVYHFQLEISTLDHWIVLSFSAACDQIRIDVYHAGRSDTMYRGDVGKKVPTPPRAAGCSGQHATRARTPLRLTPASGFFNSFPYSHKHYPGIEVGLLGNVWRIKENKGEPAQNNT